MQSQFLETMTQAQSQTSGQRNFHSAGAIARIQESSRERRRESALSPQRFAREHPDFIVRRGGIIAADDVHLLISRGGGKGAERHRAIGRPASSKSARRECIRAGQPFYFWQRAGRH